MGEWIEWSGGKQPVADGVSVDYILRDGYQDNDTADQLDWRHVDPDDYLEMVECDIVRYRIAS